MSVVLTDGFDMYNGVGVNTGLQGAWVTVVNSGVLTMVTGRFGGQAVNFGGDALTYIRRQLPSTISSFGVGFAYNEQTTQANRSTLMRLRDAGLNALVTLQPNETTGTVTVAGPSGTIGTATSQPITTLNVWHYWEVYGTFSATTGSVQVYLDGAQIINVTGVNTGAGPASWIEFAPGSGLPVGWVFWLDDLFVADSNTRLAECRVETSRPTADSSVTWTPNSGVNNYSRVNETLVDGNTSYVSTISTGVRDLYSIGSLSSTPANIYAVTAVSFAEKTDATTRQLYNSVRSASTDSDGTAFNLAASYQRLDRVINLDPATSAAWTASGVNNLLIGPKAA